MKVKKIILGVIWGVFATNAFSVKAEEVSYHHTEYVLVEDEFWSWESLPVNGGDMQNEGIIRIDQRLLVSTGHTLTINEDVRLEMGSMGLIEIEPGARLIVDGATITKAGDTPWRGIEVIGDKLKSQVFSNQGVIELKNNARIEYAELAISLIDYDLGYNKLWGTSGGVLLAENSSFIDCEKTIECVDYLGRTYEGVVLDNISMVENCEFTYTDYIKELFPEANIIGLDLWGVSGFKIVDSRFTNESIDGVGVKVTDASFVFETSIEGEAYASKISGFEYGLLIKGIDELNQVSIDGVAFENNRVGAFIDNVKFANISNNTFSIPLVEEPIDENKSIASVGLHIERSNFYTIQNNVFTGVEKLYEVSDNYDAGLIVDSSGDISEDRVYRNTFDYLSYALLVYGENGQLDDYGHRGLDIKCNDFGMNGVANQSTNYKDIYLHSNSTLDLTQGFVNNDISGPAGNRFADKVTKNGHIDIVNPELVIENYYHHSSEFAVPLNINQNQVGLSNSNLMYGSDENGPCPKRQQIRPITHNPYERVVIGGLLEDYLLLEDHFKEILNGGIKEEIIAILLNDFADESSKYEKLVLGSPYLSDDVLITLINDENLGQWLKTEILVWNAPLTKKVMRVFNEVQPLTPYLSSLVLNSSGTSQRHLLELEMKALREEIVLLETEYVLAANYDSNVENPTEELSALFELFEDAEAQRLRIAADLKQGNYITAQDELSLYDFDDNYEELKLLELQIQQENINWFQLNENDLITIEQIASEEDVYGVAKAEVVLELLNDSEIGAYTMPIAVLPEQRVAMGKAYVNANQHKLLAVSPNPAQDEFYLNYELPRNYTEAYIEVYSSLGQTIGVYDVSNYRHLYKVDSESYNAGMYFASLIVDGTNVESIPLNIIK